MRIFTYSSFLAVLVQLCLSAPFLEIPLGQTQERRDVNEDRAAAVKEAFQFAWNGYFAYAFPSDELLPVTNKSGNSRYTSY